MYEITLKLSSIDCWKTRIEELLLLLERQELFRPQKWGSEETRQYKFTIADLPKMQYRWEKYTGFLLSSNDPPFSIQLYKRMQFKQPNWIAVHIQEAFLSNSSNVQSFLNFATKLFEWGNAQHGYICHEKEFAAKNSLARPTLIDGKLIATGGMDLRKCLPGVYWANFFDKRYVEWFGKEKIVTTPSFVTKELPQSGMLILSAATPLPIDVRRKTEEVICKHLGEEAFFDIHNPTRSCVSPFQDGTIII